MKTKPLAFPILGGVILAFGYFSNLPVGGTPAPPQINAYLAELHLHGSLSEGRASMWHHSTSPATAGVDYDVLWWTDHMDRNTSRFFPFTTDFQNGDFSGTSGLGPTELLNTDRQTTVLSVEGSSDLFGRMIHANPGGSDWSGGGVVLDDRGHNYRISLFADPEIRVDLRLPPGTNGSDVNAVVRVWLSARRGNPKSEGGAPNIIEYHNVDLEPPVLLKHDRHQTVQIPKFEARGAGFSTVVMRPLADSNAHYYEGPDQTIFKIEILATCRNGKNLQLDIDNFELSVDPSKSDKNLFVAAEHLLHSGQAPYNSLTQHVGMEIAGPRYQKIQAVSGRDHLVALYRDTLENSISDLYDFMLPEWQLGWPRTGVEQVHRDNGVAILAHIFSPIIPPEVRPDEVINYLAERVLSNRAWGADGIEIGYNLRGAPLQTFLQVWDKLSAAGVYITGVGSSDHHNLKDWDLRINNMGTWIRSTSDSPSHLADAIQSGHTFFGDPYHFDSVAGDLVFTISGGKARMGEVHQLVESEPQRFKVDVVGARPGDDIVWLHNGVIVDRHHMSSSARTAFKQLTVKPGDWVRIELRTDDDRIYLMSNPIYFASFGDPIPIHRRPLR